MVVKVNLEDLSLRHYEGCAYLAYCLLDHFNIGIDLNNPKYNKLQAILTKLPLPEHFNFDNVTLELEYEIPIDGSEDGACGLAHIKDQFETIIKYIEMLIE